MDPVEESKAYIRFLVPRSQERVLPEFFAVLQQRRAELGVTDVQLSLSTLEEVFLTIARQAELETAQAEGRYEKIRLEDGTEVQVKKRGKKGSRSRAELQFPLRVQACRFKRGPYSMNKSMRERDSLRGFIPASRRI